MLFQSFSQINKSVLQNLLPKNISRTINLKSHLNSEKIIFLKIYFFEYKIKLKKLIIEGEIQKKKELFICYSNYLKVVAFNSILPYLKRKYPQKAQPKVMFLNQKIKEQDNSADNQNDLFQKYEIDFKLSSSKDYETEIMSFLNKIIQLPDKNSNKDRDINNIKTSKRRHSRKEQQKPSKTLYQQFNKFFKSIFQKIYPEKGEQQYFQKVEKIDQYTEILISRKLEIQSFKQEQINEGNFTFKKSSLMRVVTKWCRQLRKKFKYPSKLAHKDGLFKMKDGSERDLSKGQAKALQILLRKKQDKIKEELNKMIQKNLKNQANFFMEQVADDTQLAMLSQEESLVGIFSAKNKISYEKFLIDYLKELIHQCLTVMDQFESLCYECYLKDWDLICQEDIEKKIKKGEVQKKTTTKKKDSQVVNLITFRIDDLLRCKCTSKQKEIKFLYDQILMKSYEKNPIIRIVQIQNRLNKRTADIKISMMFEEKVLVELQLAVDNEKSNYTSRSDSFNHYIYQIQRGQFGPISEICNSWANENPRADFFFGQYFREKEEKICQQRKQRLIREISEIRHYNQYTKTQSQEFPSMGMAINLKGKKNTKNYFKRLQWQKKQLLINCRKNQLQSKFQKFAEVTDSSQIKMFLKDYMVLTHTQLNQRIEQDFKQNIKKEFLIPDKLKDINQKKKSSLRIEGQDLNQSNISSQQKSQFVTKVNFSDNIFQGMKAILQKYPRTEILILTKNKIQRIQTLQNISKIKFLHLQHNDLEQINGEQYQQPFQMVKLFLNHNKLEQIGHSFCNFKKLQILQIQQNNLNTIHKNFWQLKQLRQLKLSHNKIKQIPQEISSLTKLEIFTLQNNELEGLPTQFGELACLLDLDISQNYLKQLPDSFGKLEELQSISLQKNQLTHLPDIFRSLAELSSEYLDLSENNLEKLPQSFINLINIPKLNLFQNSLKELPKQFGKLKNLSLINLHKNQLSILPDSFCQLTKLTYLNIRSNNLKELPKQFGNLVNLETLNLRSNKIKRLPASFCKLKNLESLHLYQNQIEALPERFNQLANISNLQIHNNEISDSDVQLLCSLHNLKTLNISNNKIRRLNPKFKSLKKLKSLKIVKNYLIFLPLEFSQLSNLQHCQLDYNRMDRNTKKMLNKFQQSQKSQGKSLTIPIA